MSAIALPTFTALAFAERFGLSPLARLSGLPEDMLERLEASLSPQAVAPEFATFLHNARGPTPRQILYRLFKQRPEPHSYDGVCFLRSQYRLNINSVVGLLNLTVVAYTLPRSLLKPRRVLITIHYDLITPANIFRVRHRYLLGGKGKTWVRCHAERNRLTPRAH